MSAENMLIEMESEKQRVITRNKVREIYESLVEAIDKSWGFFYTEYYSDLGDEDMASRYSMTYEEAEDACRRVDYLLTKYMLDIPEELREKISTLKWTVAETVLMDTVCALCEHEEDEMEDAKNSISNLLYKGMEFQEVKYERRLKEVFAEYIVK